MNKVALGIIVLAMVFSHNLFAQSSKGREILKADVNFTDLANDEKVHPWPSVRKMPFDEALEERDQPERPEPNPTDVYFLKRGANRNIANQRGGAYLPVSAAPVDTFLATASDGTAIPPDTHGAVDSNYCVTAINTSIRIQTTSGMVISTVTLDHFWAAVMGHGTSGSGAFDPRVHYDPIINRWIMVCDAYGQTTYSQIMVAVSATSNPTGTWHMYAVATDASGATWLDFPSVGFNKKWLTVTGNYFSNSSGGGTAAGVFIFDVASIAAGSGAPFVKILETSSFSLAPAVTYDTAETSLFMVENYRGSNGQLRLWKITGPVSSPTVSSVGFPTATQRWASSNSGGTDFAPQTGTTHKLQVNDDRIFSCMQRNNTVWCSHTAFYPRSSPTRTSILWWQIDTNASPLQVGSIDDPSGANFYGFPSIAVNKNNDALIGFACFSGAIHPSCGYALHAGTDPADSTRPVYVYRHGQASYYSTFSGTQNRWGDYSATCVDPRTDVNFWTLQESVPTSPTNFWDTWWANLQLCPTRPAPIPVSGPVTLCSGRTAVCKVLDDTGATGFVWSVSGTGWSGSSTADSLVVTGGTGSGSVSVAYLNACGVGAAYTFNIASPVVATFSLSSHVLNPHVNDVITVVGPASTAATYTWNFNGGIATPGTGRGPQTVYWTNGGRKTVTLQITDTGCVSGIYTDTVHVNSVGVPELNAMGQEMTIVPNPGNGHFEIVFGQLLSKEVAVKVSDIQGRVVYEHHFDNVTDNKVAVDLPAVPAGNYIATIFADGKTMASKITVTR